MKILNSDINEKKVSLILGFFDGIHAGHRKVISSGVDFASNNNTKSVLITFKTSPGEYFQNKVEYIYPRNHSYKLIEELGVDYLIEKNFEEIAQITAENYLKSLIETYSPISISTGFNHTFGLNKAGNREYLEKFSKLYNYKYLCSENCTLNNQTISSTYIKSLIKNGDIELANKMLKNEFTLSSKVIEGAQLGRELGFPTANLKYPKNIVKLPHGVYKSKVFDMPSVLNWGIKPTVEGKEEILEVHIPNFNGDLYGKDLDITILKKLRDEKKFNSLDELKTQIKKDVNECLKS